MQERVFVAGPVSRPGGPKLPPWIEYCYECIEMAADEVQVDGRRPQGELQLDTADAAFFRAEIRKRITDSIAVIGMFLPGDPSVPAELSIATEQHKPVLVIHQPGTQVPRILAGERIAEDRDEHRMTEAIATFIRHAKPRQRSK